jgi:long-chain acyl-CoA synthetase
MMANRPWQRHYDYNVPTTIRYPRLAAHDLLGIPASAFPDKPATYFYGAEITFHELRQHVLRLANALGALGVKKGDRVGLHLPTSPQYIIAYYATLSLGAIGVNLNPMYTAEELTHLAANTGITTLFTFDGVLPHVRAVCREVDIPRVIVTRMADYREASGTSTPADLDLEAGWQHFSTLLANSTSTRLPRVSVVPEDPALIQCTGGTTGLPKGAMLTHANLVAATLQCALWGDPALGLSPPETRNVLAVYHTRTCMARS